MLLSILMTIFGLIALFEGVFLLAHIHKPFLVFDPNKNKYLPPQFRNWGIVMTIVGILSIIAGWTDSTGFLVIMVIIGCVSETLMAFAITADFRINHRK
ncbi:hypothetical protein EAI26_09645 [Lactobacillus sp. 0.1XD8-4]|uniref:DUF3784 domain-containing protein n=1 Tax=Limosilactobacillus walteri TaxID=2268022 RepID=A0ABR8P6M9_9LACO|nr:hypothetical protein [Limosilactobacillus walteri]MBD5806372.1 hypothetical protein [Limosilactobacillus walteri]MRN07637.1 hypothetical protein [Lactobacillus sp. 0.1XD8-4]